MLAIQNLRNDYLGFTSKEAVWLQQIDTNREAKADDKDKLHDLARFLDTHLVLAYSNGGDWYRVHPVIRDVVEERAKDWLSRQKSE